MSRIDHLFMPKDHMNELYNSKNPLVKFIHAGRLNSIVKIIPRKSGLKILDAGCGEGHLIEKLYKNNSNNICYGIDITEIALQKAKERCPYAKFEKKDLSKIDFDDNFFDIVICTEVLEHIFEYKTVIEELKKVVKDDGYLIITFPNETLWTTGRFLLGRKPIKASDHVNSFNPNKISSAVNMKLIQQINLPFRLPFFLSLGCLMVFKKSNCSIPTQ